jgi:hypothetical protein
VRPTVGDLTPKAGLPLTSPFYLPSLHSQRRASIMQWNPEVDNLLVVASDDDQSPTIQMWDLRICVMPLKEFVGHNKVRGERWRCGTCATVCHRSRSLWGTTR